MAKKFIIGVDIGGSKIIAALVGGAKIFHKIKILTPKNRNDFLIELGAIIRQLIKKAGGSKNIKGIGCGIGGALDLKKGVVLSWSNTKFLDGFNIKNWLSEKFNCKVKINNDAICFTYGEYLFGAGKGYKNVVSMTLGTGVGGGIVVDKKIVYGANDSAGGLGHMILNHNQDLEELTVKLMRRNRFSAKAAKEFERNLGIGIANIINILDPEAIIIGGGAVSKNLLAKVKKGTARFIVSPKSLKNVKIITGKLGENAGAIGAAALFLE